MFTTIYLTFMLSQAPKVPRNPIFLPCKTCFQPNVKQRPPIVYRSNGKSHQ
jgi:hypothetical protein